VITKVAFVEPSSRLEYARGAAHVVHLLEALTPKVERFDPAWVCAYFG